MKRKFLLLLTFVTILFTGCSVKQPELTKEENDMIAEYMAGLLLKYDIKYETKLLYASQEKDPEENLPETNLKATPKPSLNPDTKKNENTNNVDGKTEESATPKPVYQPVSAIYDDYGSKLSFLNAKVYDSYPKNSKYFLLESKKNTSWLVVSFNIENTKKNSNNFCLINEGITYRLKDGKDYSKKPLLTPLENDLQYLDVKIGAGEKTEAVIIFEIPKNNKISDYTLYITKDNIEAEVKLK